MKAPFIALWLSLAYLVVALALTGWLCLDAIQVLSRESAKATGQLEFMSPAWVVAGADNAVSRLYWLCASVGLGILFVGMSTVWVSLSKNLPKS
jgi:hypothetical protein